MTPGALAGLRVIDLSEDVSGPYCTRLLAGLGAVVIKVERPGGDPARRAGPFPGDVPHPELGGRHLHLNAGKQSVTLDVSTGSGRRLLHRLLADADVLVESLPPANMVGATRRVAPTGLDNASLAGAHPRLVVTSVSHFGRTGSYRDFAGCELVAYALGGYLVLTGDPGREPLKAYDHQVELQAGLHAAVGTLAALRVKADGAHPGENTVDVAAYEAATFLLGGPAQVYALTGEDLRRNGMRLIGLGPHHPYPSTLRPCRGGYVHVHSNNRHPDLLALLIGAPHILAPHILAAPSAHADAIDAAIDAWLADKDKFEAVRAAQELRVPFTEVMAPDEVLADPHYEERGFWADLDHPEAGRLRYPGPPLRMHATPWESRRTPLLGEHNEAIYQGRLGLPARRLAVLRAAGVI